jgi:hypothetical protein
MMKPEQTQSNKLENYWWTTLKSYTVKGMTKELNSQNFSKDYLCQRYQGRCTKPNDNSYNHRNPKVP